jgi:hypothetical protein
MISGNQLFVSLVLLTNAGCASSPRARPTEPVRFDPLYLPGATLLCRPKPVPFTTLPVVVFEFEDGELMVSDRLINAAYDSLGGPRLLVMTATESAPDGSPIMHALSVSYPDDSPATGFRAVSPPGVDESAVPREVLSPAMITKSRDLMVWLWNHRCSPERIQKR